MADKKYTAEPTQWEDLLTKEQKELVKEHSTVLEFSANEIIIKQGIAARHILYLEQGMAKLSITQKEKSTIFKIIPPESFIGIMCSFIGKSFDFSATAIQPCRVRLIDRTLFEELIRVNGDFAVKMVELMSQSTNKIVHDLIKISHKNVDGAISTVLLELSSIYKSDKFVLPFSRIEIADMIGYSKESVINSISSLHNDGVIKVSAKNVEIQDKERLEFISRIG